MTKTDRKPAWMLGDAVMRITDAGRASSQSDAQMMRDKEYV